MKYNIGDKVKLKSWDKMVEECGCNENGDILCAGLFLVDMKKFCNKVVIICDFSESGGYNIKNDKDVWEFTDDMFEPVDTPAKESENCLKLATAITTDCYIFDGISVHCAFCCSSFIGGKNPMRVEHKQDCVVLLSEQIIKDNT